MPMPMPMPMFSYEPSLEAGYLSRQIGGEAFFDTIIHDGRNEYR